MYPMAYNRAETTIMKKVFTLFAALAVLATASFAQGNLRLPQKAQKPVKTASLLKTSNPVRTAKKSGAKIAGNPVWEDTMSYCLNTPFWTGVGMESGSFSWGIKIEPAALAGRNNLTDVQIFVCATGSYQLDIYNAGTTSPSGTAVTQNVTATAADTMTWKNIHLTNPVAINAAQPLWVIFTTTAAETYPASAIHGNQFDNGKFVGLDGDWMNVADAGVDATWMIRAISDTYIPQPPMLYIDAPAIALVNEPATFTATTSVSSLTWYVDGTQNTETGLSLTYTFTTAGMHEIVAEATNAVGTAFDTVNVNVIDCSQGISSFPYFEGFEAVNPCWQFVSADPANDAFAGISSDEQHAGNSSFALSSYAEADDYNQYFITPEFNLTAGTDYMVSFWYKGDHAADAFRVKVSSTTNDTAAFTTVLADYPTVNTEWTLVALQLPANTKYIAFNYYGDYQYYLYIDEFSVDEMGVPTVSVNGDTYIGTGMEATYVATANLADTVEWLVDGESVAANGDTMTYMFTTAGMHEVVAMASNTYGSAYDTISVEVFNCDDITIPYTPDFTMGLGCWSNRSDLEEGYGWLASADAFESDPEGQIISMSGVSFWGMMMNVDVDNWLISPVITMPENGNYEIAWSVKPYTTDYAGDHYGVYIIEGTDTTLLFEETLNSSMTDYVDRAAAIPSTVTGDFHIAFRHFNSAGGYVIIIDDIEIRDLSVPHVSISGPTTAEKDIEVEYTANSGNAETYSWSIDGTEVAGVTGNTLTYTFTTAGNHTVAVTGINAVGTSDAATLTVMVIACDHIANFPYTEDFEGEINCWKFFDADGDGYNWDNTAFSGEHQGHNESEGLIASASYINNIGALTPDNWMVMPAVDVPAGSNLYLNWFAKGQDEEYYEEYYSVYISTTGYNVNDFTNAVFSETTTNEWAGHHVSLANYAGQTIYIAFRHHNVTDMFYLDIDDISISETAVGINNVNDINVNIYPNPVSCVLNIEGEGIEQVEVMDLNGRIILTSAATSLNIENLASGVYMVRVIAAEGTRVEKIVKK